MGLGNVVNQLHNQDSLADTGTTEQTNLTTLGVGGEEVDNLDTSDQDLLLDAHLGELGSLSVDGAPLVNWVTNNVDNSTEGLGTDGDHDGRTSVEDLLATDKTLSTVHSNGTDSVLSQVLGNLEHKLGFAVGHSQGVEDLWETIIELNVDDGTND